MNNGGSLSLKVPPIILHQNEISYHIMLHNHIVILVHFEKYILRSSYLNVIYTIKHTFEILNEGATSLKYYSLKIINKTIRIGLEG